MIAPLHDEATRCQWAWERRDRRAGLVSLMEHDAAFVPDFAATLDARERLARVLSLREGRELVRLIMERRGAMSGADRARLRRLRCRVTEAVRASYGVGGAA